MTAGPPWTGALDGLVSQVVEHLAVVADPGMFVLAVPSFPDTGAGVDDAHVEVADELLRRVAVDAGLDRWAACSVAWERVDDADDHGLPAADIVRGLAATGRATHVTVAPVGLPGDLPGLIVADRTAVDVGVHLRRLDPVDPGGTGLTEARRSVGAAR